MVDEGTGQGQEREIRTEMEGVVSVCVSEAEVMNALLSISLGLTLSPPFISVCLVWCAVTELVLIKRARS